MRFKEVAELIEEGESTKYKDFDFEVNDIDKEFKIKAQRSEKDEPMKIRNVLSSRRFDITTTLSELTILHVAIFYNNEKAVKDLLNDRQADPTKSCNKSEKTLVTFYEKKGNGYPKEKERKAGDHTTGWYDALELAQVYASAEIQDMIKNKIAEFELRAPPVPQANALKPPPATFDLKSLPATLPPLPPFPYGEPNSPLLFSPIIKAPPAPLQKNNPTIPPSRQKINLIISEEESEGQKDTPTNSPG